MLTLFTVPKPFEDHIGVIQHNAISSWRKLDPICEIILCGNEPGTREAADRFDAIQLGDVNRNEFGTPLLDSVFASAHAAASYPMLCYVNADIILLHDFTEAVRRIEFANFLMVGRRWDVDLTQSWDFEASDGEEQLRCHVGCHGTLHPPTGSDYFVFPRNGGFDQLPPFAVGRPVWDNWLIHRARQRGLPVVDVTPVVTVVHQNHDYRHVPQRTGHTWEGPEADVNRELAGGWKNVFTLADVTHVMTGEAILPAAEALEQQEAMSRE